MKFASFDPNKITYHKKAEEIAQHLCTFTENNNPTFFRVMTSYFLAKVASQMRTTFKLPSQKALPINMYATALAPSGAGKSKSMGFLEDELCGLFSQRFKEELLPWAAEQNVAKLAVRNAVKNQTDPADERKKLADEFERSGAWLNSFDSATSAAIRQFRHKLLLSDAGSLNFEIDEVGANLTNNREAFSKMLELYDKGSLKEALIKNTKDNVRLSEIVGQTPTNLIMFGTPSSLLDGSKKEEEFHAMLEEGYARRCLFAFTKTVERDLTLTAEEIYQRNMNQSSHKLIEDFSEHLLTLADAINYKRELIIEKPVEILRIEYHLWCQHRAENLSEFEVVKRIELEHRWFKALKLAAAYAFIDNSAKITEDHVYNAIAVVEDSGDDFGRLLTRDRPYVKLASYLGSVPREVTQVELVEDLPFYKGTNQQRAEMLNMAIAYGYQNNIVIKKSFIDGIEFLKGESLQETNLDNLLVSYSNHVAYNYVNDSIKWEDNVQKLVQMEGMHWCTHHFNDNHRCDDKAITGFNMLVIDVDGTFPMQSAQTLLKEFTSIFYTTKRHGQDGQDRYRIVLPMKYVLKLDGNEYKEFMQSIYDWLPFKVDDDTGQRSRKWLSNHKTTLVTNDGSLFDPLEYIPKTTNNEKRKAKLIDQQALSNIERWFVNNTGAGNRSNQLIKFALLLVDGGNTMNQVQQAVLSLNEKLADSLPEEEILTTIMVTATRHFNKVSI
jgi:hypothetical protein